MRCPSCGSTDMLSVTLTIEGSPTLVRICTMCDTRVWERDGEEFRSDEVVRGLQRHRKRK